jgi:acetyl esterase/lipase
VGSNFSVMSFMLRTAYCLLLATTLLAQGRFPAGTRVQRGTAYNGFPETRLDIYQPPGAMGNRPGVMVIHGGGWTEGERAGMVDAYVRRYVEKGFVVANIEYRLAKAAPAPAAVEDAIHAANWFVDNAKLLGVDPKRIVVTGGSAGGHLALMVGMVNASARLGKPVKVRAVVNFYGITDVEDQVFPPNQRDYAMQWLPEQPGRRELARRVSPLTYVRRDLPAILTLHGDADDTVPYEHGVRLTKALTAVGAAAELITVPGGLHGFPAEQLDGLYGQIFAFLAKHGVL